MDFPYDEIEKTMSIEIKDDLIFIISINEMCNCKLDRYFKNNCKFELKLIVDDTNRDIKT